MTVLDDAELEEAVRELATAMGKPETDSLRIAVREKLQQIRMAGTKRIDWEAVRAIQDRIASRPVLNEGSEDELLGYNERGTFD